MPFEIATRHRLLWAVLPDSETAGHITELVQRERAQHGERFDTLAKKQRGARRFERAVRVRIRETRETRAEQVEAPRSTGATT